MVGWHHRFKAHEFEQTLGDDGQGSLVCCSSWDPKESDKTERLNNKINKFYKRMARGVLSHNGRI